MVILHFQALHGLQTDDDVRSLLELVIAAFPPHSAIRKNELGLTMDRLWELERQVLFVWPYSSPTGDRGRADAVGAGHDGAETEPTAATETSVVSGPSGLRAELEAMRMGSLCVRAARAGVDAAALDAAEDSPDPKAAIIQLILVEEALLAM